MRKRVHSKYDADTWPLLEYFAARLNMRPEDAQLGAVIAMAKEMIERDQRSEAANAIPERIDPTIGVPTPEGTDQPGDTPTAGDNPGDGSNG